jgi:hypothetical protein
MIACSGFLQRRNHQEHKSSTQVSHSNKSLAFVAVRRFGSHHDGQTQKKLIKNPRSIFVGAIPSFASKNNDDDDESRYRLSSIGFHQSAFIIIIIIIVISFILLLFHCYRRLVFH